VRVQPLGCGLCAIGLEIGVEGPDTAADLFFRLALLVVEGIERKGELTKRFEEIFSTRTGFATLNKLLSRLKAQKGGPTGPPGFGGDRKPGLAARLASISPLGIQNPRSHSMTVTPPYSTLGMVPSKPPSRRWDRRRDLWLLPRALTGRGRSSAAARRHALKPESGTWALDILALLFGSAVLAKSRLAWYSASRGFVIQVASVVFPATISPKLVFRVPDNLCRR
jgi:hypothetical protein